MSAAVGGFYMLNVLHPITSRRTCPQRFERLFEQTEDQPGIESCDTADVAYVSHLKALLSHLKKSSNHSLARSLLSFHSRVNELIVLTDMLYIYSALPLGPHAGHHVTKR